MDCSDFEILREWHNIDLLAISKEILDLMRYFLENQNMMKGEKGDVKGKEKEKRKKFRTDPVKGRTEFSGSHAKYAQKEESS